MATSFVGEKGLSTTHLLNLVVNTLYDKFVEKNINEFDGFSVGILDTFNSINMALPGKHYVTPSYKDIKDLFEQWKESNKEDKKKIFTKFINQNVNLNKADESMLITAIVAPPAAMMAKKTGQIVPQLALMNAIPDVVFVPSATLLALIAIKIVKLTFIGKTTSKYTKSHMQSTPEQKRPTKPDTGKKPQIPSASTTEQEPQTKIAIKEPQITIEQKPQTTTAIKEPQIATEQESHTTTALATAIEKEPQTAFEQGPQTTTAPTTAIDKEPQTTTAPVTAIEKEPQTTTALATSIEKEPQIAIEQEIQTATALVTAIEKEPQTVTKQEPHTTIAPAAAIEKEPQTKTPAPATEEISQIGVAQEPQTTTAPSNIRRHVHKDNTFCALCDELIAMAKEGSKV